MGLIQLLHQSPPQLVELSHRQEQLTLQLELQIPEFPAGTPAAAELLASVASPRWRRVYLTHLSRDCNSVAAVEQAFAGVRATLTACEFSIVEQGVSTPVYELT